MSPERHRRFLEYRERHVYFGKLTPLLGAAAFEILDEEYEMLVALGEAGRDDEQELRFEEVADLLFRD